MLTNCPQCGSTLKYEGYGKTLVGYYSPPGHDHDDNCKTHYYRCENGHRVLEFKQNICPKEGCDWKGKELCEVCGPFRVSIAE